MVISHICLNDQRTDHLFVKTRWHSWLAFWTWPRNVLRILWEGQVTAASIRSVSWTLVDCLELSKDIAGKTQNFCKNNIYDTIGTKRASIFMYIWYFFRIGFCHQTRLTVPVGNQPPKGWMTCWLARIALSTWPVIAWLVKPLMPESRHGMPWILKLCRK